MGVWDIMRISLSGLRTSQTGIEVVSHNVANMNTTGYSRETPIIEPYTPRQIGGVFLGSGVNATSIHDAEDRFLNYNIYMTSQKLGYQDVTSNGLASIENLFTESEDVDGLGAALTAFWNSWNELATTPEGSAERNALVGQTEILCSQFRSMRGRLSDVADNADVEISNLCKNINVLAKKIRDLNIDISKVESNGQKATDYRTQRNQAMEELSGYIDYTYFEGENGMVTINVAGGMPLVETVTVGRLEVRSNAANHGYKDVLFVSSTGSEFNITDKITGGEMYGNLQIRDRYVGGYQDKLDELAYNLVQQVNSLHVTGYGLNNATGNEFFAPLASVDGAASVIALDASILADISNVAASAAVNTPGDNSIAQQIVALRDALTMDGATTTFGDFYGAVVADVGQQASNASNSFKQTSMVQEQNKNLRDGETGVSIEEEMAKLIVYQQAYQAAARVMTSASQLIDILNNV